MFLTVAASGYGLMSQIRALDAWPPEYKVGVATVLALVLAGWRAWSRLAEIRAWLARWNDLSRDMERQVRTLAEDLATLLNHRLRLVKMAASDDLRRALVARRGRLATEIGGLYGLAEDELVQREQLHQAATDLERTRPGHTIGSFQVHVGETHQSVSDQAFHLPFEALLSRTLNLDGVPERLTVSEHEELLRTGIQRAAGTELARTVTAAAESLFTQCCADGFSMAKLAKIGRGTDSDRRIFFCGSLVKERLGDAAVPQSDEPFHTVETAGFPSESAAAMLVRRVVMS